MEDTLSNNVEGKDRHIQAVGCAQIHTQMHTYTHRYAHTNLCVWGLGDKLKSSSGEKSRVDEILAVQFPGSSLSGIYIS